jgi:hypothetical protein
MHSSQMCTPGPATSRPTSVLGLPQNEHRGSSAVESAMANTNLLVSGFP